MAKIQPVVFPLNLGTADKLEINIGANPSVLGARISYLLLSSTTIPHKQLSNGFLNLTEEQFIAHGNDKKWIEDYVIEQLGVTKIVD